MITAIYSGGGPFSGSTSPALSEVVNPAPSAVSLASSLNPSQPGQNVTLTATVSSSFGIASGMVTFKDFGTSIGSPALNSSGVATLSTASLSLGPHSLVAIYSGDSAHFGSASKGLTQIVKTAQQTT